MKLLKNNQQLKNLFYSDYISVRNETTNTMEQLYVPIYKRIYTLEDIDCMGEIIQDRNIKDKKLDTETEKNKDKLN